MLNHLFCTLSVQNSEKLSGTNDRSGLKVVICCETRKDQIKQPLMGRFQNLQRGANPVKSPANSYLFLFLPQRDSSNKATIMRSRKVFMIHQLDLIAVHARRPHVCGRLAGQILFSPTSDSSISVEEPSRSSKPISWYSCVGDISVSEKIFLPQS